jgi:SAM-dependent methyltransferase
MSGASIGEFIGYWQNEGEAYARRGDYDWMASLIPGKRILEVGCGVGFGTVALARRGLAVLAIDSLTECLEACRERLRDIPEADVTLLEAEVTTLTGAARGAIEAFAPDAVACWLMGAPGETTGAGPSDAGQAVTAYREKIHRAVAELAASLPGVKALHIVDRTVIPWQAKDIGRDTLVGYHSGKTLLGLPFAAERRHALYRKLEGGEAGLAGIRRSHPSLKSVVPTLASLVAERKN